MQSAHDAIKATLPHRERLIEEILKVLEASKSPLPASEIDGIVSRNLKVTDAQLSIIRSGKRTEFAYAMAWARTMAKSRELIHQPTKRLWAAGPGN